MGIGSRPHPLLHYHQHHHHQRPRGHTNGAATAATARRWCLQSSSPLKGRNWKTLGILLWQDDRSTWSSYYYSYIFWFQPTRVSCNAEQIPPSKTNSGQSSTFTSTSSRDETCLFLSPPELYCRLPANNGLKCVASTWTPLAEWRDSKAERESGRFRLASKAQRWSLARTLVHGQIEVVSVRALRRTEDRIGGEHKKRMSSKSGDMAPRIDTKVFVQSDQVKRRVEKKKKQSSSECATIIMGFSIFYLYTSLLWCLSAVAEAELGSSGAREYNLTSSSINSSQTQQQRTGGHDLSAGKNGAQPPSSSSSSSVCRGRDKIEHKNGLLEEMPMMMMVGQR